MAWFLKHMAMHQPPKSSQIASIVLADNVKNARNTTDVNDMTLTFPTRNIVTQRNIFSLMDAL